MIRSSKATAAKRRAEAVVIQEVREQVMVRRDYRGCRAGTEGGLSHECEGFLQWAHMAGHRRHETRRMDPMDRHSTTWTLALCGLHHVRYDRHELDIQVLTDAGADGPLRFLRSEGGDDATRTPSRTRE